MRRRPSRATVSKSCITDPRVCHPVSSQRLKVLFCRCSEVIMAKILAYVTVGPSDPTKAVLAFFVAGAVIEEGIQLGLFVANGVHL